MWSRLKRLFKSEPRRIEDDGDLHWYCLVPATAIDEEMEALVKREVRLAKRYDVLNDEVFGDGIRAIHRAAMLGREDIIEELLKANAAVGDCLPHRSACFMALRHGNANCARLLWRHGDLRRDELRNAFKISCLPRLMKADVADCVSFVLERGVDVTQVECMLCRAPNDLALVKVLLDAGADPDIREQPGFTPLHLLASSTVDPNVECAAALLEAGADVNALTDGGSTPLSRLCCTHTDCVALARLFVENGADIGPKVGDREQSVDGRITSVPLWAAATSGSEQILRFLISEGASVNIMRKLYPHETPLVDALNQRMLGCAATLLESGAILSDWKTHLRSLARGSNGLVGAECCLHALFDSIVKHGDVNALRAEASDVLATAIGSGNLMVVNCWLERLADKKHPLDLRLLANTVNNASVEKYGPRCLVRVLLAGASVDDESLSEIRWHTEYSGNRANLQMATYSILAVAGAKLPPMPTMKNLQETDFLTRRYALLRARRVVQTTLLLTSRYLLDNFLVGLISARLWRDEHPVLSNVGTDDLDALLTRIGSKGRPEWLIGWEECASLSEWYRCRGKTLTDEERRRWVEAAVPVTMKALTRRDFFRVCKKLNLLK